MKNDYQGDQYQTNIFSFDYLVVLLQIPNIYCYYQGQNQYLKYDLNNHLNFILMIFHFHL